MKKIRTGLYGGSFNPIHNGHIAIARQMIEKVGLDEVWFIVSPQNPLKERDTLLDDAKRLEMARKALEGQPRLKACDYEFALPRPSYTWHTLQSLWRNYPDREFVLMIGADNWAHFGRWYHADDIMRTCNILIYPRRGYNVDALSLPARAQLVDTGLYDVSSTEIRQLIKEGRDISSLVPADIVDMAEKYYGATAAV